MGVELKIGEGAGEVLRLVTLGSLDGTVEPAGELGEPDRQAVLGVAVHVLVQVLHLGGGGGERRVVNSHSLRLPNFLQFSI